MKKGKPRLQLPSYVRWILWVLLVQIILINISAAFYAHKLTHVYTDRALRSARPSKNIFVKTWRLFTGPRQAKSIITETPTFPFDTVVLKTAKGITIDAWYSKPDSQSRGTVILFHGITANKGMIVNEAHEFRSQGYNVMLVDYRAHGNSEGQTTTIGVRESEEVKLAYAYIAGKGENNIFLWGSSMGAVVVAKAIAEYNLKPAGAMLEMPLHLCNRIYRPGQEPWGFKGYPQSLLAFSIPGGWE